LRKFIASVGEDGWGEAFDDRAAKKGGDLAAHGAEDSELDGLRIWRMKRISADQISFHPFHPPNP
jgi:hypothetical protein